jgi:UDP-hydrolysing UDP-N-acetyl-D-glucosamine 2-epimerase
MRNKKICIITAARSEYGLLRWLIEAVQCDNELDLQLVVTGTHLSTEYGNTIKEIESDGYAIAVKVDMKIQAGSTTLIAKSMGNCAIGMAEALENLKPDIVVILGDRYELLPICNTALVMNIPIAHISGGDITEGAIDDQIRNAVSMMATLHFPGVEASAKNLRRMRGDRDIFVVGEPGLENFLRLELIDRETLAKSLNIDPTKKWVLVTQHSETTVGIGENSLMAQNIIESLQSLNGFEFIITKANADSGGNEINAYFEQICAEDFRFKLFASLGQLRYLSFMKEADFLVGNSSSGVVEALYFAKPVINIGERQTGRYMGKNILAATGFDSSVAEALALIQSDEWRSTLQSDFYYGDGKSAEKIKIAIKQYLNKCKK